MASELLAQVRRADASVGANLFTCRESGKNGAVYTEARVKPGV